jgi:Protein of unknown function (DUF2630)
MTDDSTIHDHITDLVNEEKELRRRLAAGEISREDEHARLADIERRLDQYWDLLRQREARREFGGDPDQARVRPEDVVERYEG